jgi:hypothetical protein
MKSKSLREIQHLNQALSKSSWTNYRKLLGRLCQDFIHLPYTSKIAGLLRNNDVLGLVALADSLSEQKYLTAADHFAANQFAALIKKYPFPSDLNPFDPEKKAREKFELAEDKCLLQNSFFENQFDFEPSLQYDFSSMRNFIAYVIGYEPKLSTIYKRCDFSPGASVGVHGNATNIARKLASRWSVSPSAALYARSAILNNWHFTECLLSDVAGSIVSLDPDLASRRFWERVDLVPYNKIAFVPKTAKTFRSIAVEPLLNGYLQKGVDSFLRQNLLRVGIDISDQTINSRMAHQGSLEDSDNSFVTIDLSSASDSISIGLCRNLLPPAWFEFLNSIRSKSFLDKGVQRPYTKFCSMGNGFCFPLETLLFTSACVAVGAGTASVDFHVYGDDIIVRKRFAKPLLRLLGVMGFEVNTDKTFIEGPFRESCGTEWFHGKDVRPFVLDFALDDLSCVFKFLNLSKRSEICKIFFDGVGSFLKELIPESSRLLRPFSGPADSAITVDLDEFMSSTFARWDRSLQCWSWKELIRSPLSDRDWRTLRSAHNAHMMAALRGTTSERPFTVRRKTRTTVRRVAYG